MQQYGYKGLDNIIEMNVTILISYFSGIGIYLSNAIKCFTVTITVQFTKLFM